ncbi:ABC transporter substrate-binding protein [Verticiella sediminum]|uniref:Thiamine pyrimidine synthase n=1 Tax=Verticiella sediminum TaxID=1247510 RepID=A0A556AYV5_9BURK|nr:ABC transporter substrate-binding protein [Verticiella sediminum]TSH98076.1 ABC transporter substrate-binding protein [Verticiella sediminum]
MSFRLFARVSSVLAGTCLAVAAQAQTPIKFQLDWRFEGPAALFTHPAAQGYFKEAGLDVTVDSGSGSAASISRVASGSYEMGFADMAALMEFHANNPEIPNKPVAVMVVYNNTPAAVLSLRKAGIATPKELAGRKLGAPVFDAGRRAFPLFAAANEVGEVSWTSMDPPLRETMLMRGDVDAITGFSFTSLLSLETRGVKTEDINVFAYPDYGVKLYGNVIIASPKLIEENPAAVTAFLGALAKGAGEVVRDPEAAIGSVKARDGLIDLSLELRRLKLALDSVVVSDDARKDGFGRVDPERLALMGRQVSDTYATKTPVDVAAVWNGGLLPEASVLDAVLPSR